MRRHIGSIALRILPVRLSVLRPVTRKQRNVEKSKLAETFPTARVSGLPIFSSKDQRSRSQDLKPSKPGDVIFTYGRQAPTAHSGLRHG